MPTIADIEAALGMVLPPDLRAQARTLALPLADVVDGALAPAEAQARIGGDPDLVPVLQALAGRTLEIGEVAIQFGDGQRISVISRVAAIDVVQNVTVTGGTVGDIIGKQITYNYYTFVERPHDRNRQAMLQKVRQIWLEDLLDRSLADVVRIDLGLSERPDAVLLPLATQYQELNHPPRVLPVGAPLIDVFAALGGALLILGAPGAGKTTLLLELARSLISRAEQDHNHPLPVIFNLSSWAAARRPLSAWFVEELCTKYDVPRRIARGWADADALLPLLDGLDEVDPVHREACVEAINMYRQEHGIVPLAVSSRTADYEALSKKLRLRGAIIVQPLTTKQIDAYLEQTGDQLAAVQAALRDDEVLYELVETPLMLSIVTLAYRGVALGTLPTMGSSAEQRERVFAAYIDRMFRRRGTDVRYSRAQTMRWLTWLAGALSRHTQTIFFLERLQPDWLPTRRTRWQYALIDRLSGMLFAGLILGTALGFVTGLDAGLDAALNAGLGFGLTGALVGGLFGETRDTVSSIRRGVRRMLSSAALGGLVVGISMGLAGGVGAGISEGVSAGLILGLIGALAGMLAGGPAIRPRCVITVETLHWSWSNAKQSLLIFGLIFGLISAMGSGLIGLVVGLTVGLGYGLIGALTGGRVETTMQPNQGIRRSARSALISALTGALIMGAVGWLAVGVSGGWKSGLISGVVGGLISALLCGLSYGGYACLSHFALRLVLWRSGAFPWHSVRFLNYAAERIILHKVGGGYIFIHRLLLEYFASLETASDHISHKHTGA
ncbi:MAG: NACHT domain-containing protein [Chloroflexota bacterium]|nr:NACHT domain-containing protein [Chloroflexota bacterium]